MIKLSIIIVTWNGKHLMRTCLNSIYRFIKYLPFEVIMVDNASSDGSIDLISKEFPLVEIIRNRRNVGFAGGVNKGIDIARGEYILFLNNDTELLDNAFLPMIEFMDKNPKIGILGCKLKSREGKIENSCDAFPTFGSRIIGKICERVNFLRKIGISMRYWNYDRLREVDVVSGACLLARHDLVQKIGKLDERFFMYHEDTDFCYRAKREGFKTYFFPYSTIIHEYSSSMNWELIEKKIVHRETQYLFIKKHYGLFEKSLFKFCFSTIATFFIFGNHLRNNTTGVKNWKEIRSIFIESP